MTDFLKECMADALIRLMGTKEFSKITINEIVALAGVNRSTWFRNFSTKSEAITFKLVCLWQTWADEHKIEIRNKYTIENAETFFEYNYTIRDILRKIYDANLQTSVYSAFRIIMLQDCSVNTDSIDFYEGTFYYHALFGVLSAWIQRNFQESPEEMSTILRKVCPF